MTSPARSYLTPADYLAAERRAEHRSEYFHGEVFAMAGASREHNLIVTNLVAALHLQLAGRDCELYASDMRVKVSATGLYTYPDVVVACGSPEFEDEEGDTLLNPTLIVEVLSPGTEQYDRGAKFEHYRRLPSLKEYLLVAQANPQVERFARLEAGWLMAGAGGLQTTLHLDVIGCALPLADVYARIQFPVRPGAPR